MGTQSKVDKRRPRGRQHSVFPHYSKWKHRKKKIIQLEQDEGSIVGHGNLKLYISNYYKQLFGPPKDSSISLDGRANGDIAPLNTEENEFIFCSVY